MIYPLIYAFGIDSTNRRESEELSLWFELPHSIFPSSTHRPARYIIFFFFAAGENYIIIFQSQFEGYLVASTFLAVLNRVPMNMSEKVSVQLENQSFKVMDPSKNPLLLISDTCIISNSSQKKCIFLFTDECCPCLSLKSFLLQNLETITENYKYSKLLKL